MRALAAVLLALVLASRPSAAADADRAMDRAHRILAEARAEAARGCGPGSDALARVLCAGVLRVGTRADYRGFGFRTPDGAVEGYDADVGRAIGEFLDARWQFVRVDPRTRMSVLAGREADLVIATLGHTAARDPNARFVRPHYYESHTSIVGRRDARAQNWTDLRSGPTPCVPLAAGSNIIFAQQRIHVLVFDTAQQLADALRQGLCQLAAHDNTFFAAFARDPAWAARFEPKFGFASLPWGIAAPVDGGERFADLLGALSAAWHADGTFLRLADAHGQDGGFLRDRQTQFAGDGCVGTDGRPSPDCLLPPVDTSALDSSTPFAGHAEAAERWLADELGWHVDLSMLRSAAKFRLLLEGAGYSVAIVAGAMGATVVFAYALAAASGSARRPLRWLGRGASLIGQSTPMPLQLLLGYVVAGGLLPYTPLVASLTAIVMLGFYNGSYVARALHDARALLPPGTAAWARGTLPAVWSQIAAFMVNTAKGAPAADMIGVPEFLGAIVDLTAHARDRMPQYALLLAFYTLLVLGAIRLLSLAERTLMPRLAGRAP